MIAAWVNQPFMRGGGGGPVIPPLVTNTPLWKATLSSTANLTKFNGLVGEIGPAVQWFSLSNSADLVKNNPTVSSNKLVQDTSGGGGSADNNTWGKGILGVAMPTNSHYMQLLPGDFAAVRYFGSGATDETNWLQHKFLVSGGNSTGLCPGFVTSASTPAIINAAVRAGSNLLCAPTNPISLGTASKLIAAGQHMVKVATVGDYLFYYVRDFSSSVETAWRPMPLIPFGGNTGTATYNGISMSAWSFTPGVKVGAATRSQGYVGDSYFQAGNIATVLIPDESTIKEWYGRIVGYGPGAKYGKDVTVNMQWRGTQPGWIYYNFSSPRSSPQGLFLDTWKAVKACTVTPIGTDASGVAYGNANVTFYFPAGINNDELCNMCFAPDTAGEHHVTAVKLTGCGKGRIGYGQSNMGGFSGGYSTSLTAVGSYMYNDTVALNPPTGVSGAMIYSPPGLDRANAGTGSSLIGTTLTVFTVPAVHGPQPGNIIQGPGITRNDITVLAYGTGGTTGVGGTGTYAVSVANGVNIPSATLEWRSSSVDIIQQNWQNGFAYEETYPKYTGRSNDFLRAVSQAEGMPACMFLSGAAGHTIAALRPGTDEYDRWYTSNLALFGEPFEEIWFTQGEAEATAQLSTINQTQVATDWAATISGLRSLCQQTSTNIPVFFNIIGTWYAVDYTGSGRTTADSNALKERAVLVDLATTGGTNFGQAITNTNLGCHFAGLPHENVVGTFTGIIVGDGNGTTGTLTVSTTPTGGAVVGGIPLTGAGAPGNLTVISQTLSADNTTGGRGTYKVNADIALGPITFTGSADVYHFGDKGHVSAGRRMAFSSLKKSGLGSISGMGPTYGTPSRSGATINVPVNLNGATALSTTTGSTTLTPDVWIATRVSDSVKFVATSATWDSANSQVVVVLASDPGSAVDLTDYYGTNCEGSTGDGTNRVIGTYPVSYTHFGISYGPYTFKITAQPMFTLVRVT